MSINGRFLALEIRRLYLAEQGYSDKVVSTTERVPRRGYDTLQFSVPKSDARTLHFHLGAARKHMEVARTIAKENKVISKLALTPDFIKHAKAREATALQMIGDNDE